jgi:hypothetical protein
MSMRVPLVLALTAATGACYTYRPIEGTEPAPGHAVRVEVNAEGTDRLARQLGPRITQLEGRVASLESDTLRFLVRVARTPEFIESYFKDDTVSLPRTAISGMSERKLSTGPTVAVGGLLVAGAIGAASALSGDAGYGGGRGLGGPVNPE